MSDFGARYRDPRDGYEYEQTIPATDREEAELVAGGRARCWRLVVDQVDDVDELPPIPAAGWDELDCGGVYDGFQVTSDADPGL